MQQELAFLIAGLALLIAGAELLVSGASSIAKRMGVAPILIALTVVAFGTSTPEFAVSLLAALRGQTDLAVANVVGSNSFNIGIILGISALLRPLKVEEGSLKREIPFVLGAPILLWVLCRDGSLGRPDGFILMSFFIAFLRRSFRGSARASNAEAAATSANRAAIAMPIIAVLAGLAGLVLGARWFTEAAVAIARDFGVSELVIGLTLVSAGTSLPELTTSILAALRSKDDIAVGNVTGSNIFNVLFILGSVAIVKPLVVGGAMVRFDIPVMAAFSLSVLPLMRTGMRISRLEGGLLLLGYFAYLATLFS